MIEKRKPLTELAGQYSEIRLPDFSYSGDNPLFIDIETTGFSATKTMIYAIGCIYQAEGIYYFHQMFAENVWDEANLLLTLESILQDQEIDLLVHFNGFYFDIPFLLKRYEILGLSTSLDSVPQFDFYLYKKRYRDFFDLPNLRLKTLEKVLKLDRNDQMSGGDLISVYERYLLGEDELLPLLLQHNEEDLLATFLLGHFLPLLEAGAPKSSGLPLYQNFPNCLKQSTEEEICLFNRELRKYLMEHFDSRYFSDLMEKTYVQHYPIIETELLHFYPDYQNYTYLPEEDYAIHNSVAQFVESSFRKKATKKTAFLRKFDRFVPVPSNAADAFGDYPLFQRSYSNKERFIRLQDLESYIDKVL